MALQVEDLHLALELVAPRAPLLSVCLSVYLPISPSMLPSLIIHGSAVCPQAQQAAAVQASSAATLPTVSLNEIETPQSLDNVRD